MGRNAKRLSTTLTPGEGPIMDLGFVSHETGLNNKCSKECGRYSIFDLIRLHFGLITLYIVADFSSFSSIRGGIEKNFSNIIVTYQYNVVDSRKVNMSS